MDVDGGEAVKEVLATLVIGVLRRHARHSAHPADHAALRRAAAQIAVALDAEFTVVVRPALPAEQTNREPLNEHAHE